MTRAFTSPAALETLRLKTTTQRFIAIGDSVIYGYGDHDGGGWVERLRRTWMQHNGPVLYNLGVRGDGVHRVIQRLEFEFQQRGEIRNQVPDGIIVSVGMNDSPRLGRPDGRNFIPFEAFEVAIAQLLEQSQRLCPVWFVGMPPVDESKMPFMGCLYYNHADQYRYNEATRLACEARHIPYLDVFDLWRSRGAQWCKAHMMADGLHPNVQGYEALLEDVLSWNAIPNILAG
jgi:lysophospholipase L1-like esterase